MTCGEWEAYMSEIRRLNLDNDAAERNAYSEIVVAGDFVFLSFCVGNVGQCVE